MQIETEGVVPNIPEEDSHDFANEIGLAVDVGTSTVAVSAWSLKSRKCLATVAEKNAQIRYGYDVIRRISFATRAPLLGSAQVIESGSSALHYSIITQLEKMFVKVVNLVATKFARGIRPEVKRIVITGNTTMLSFVCAVPVDGLSVAPFSPSTLFGFSAYWENVRSGNVIENSVVLDAPTPDTLKLYETSVIPPETPIFFPPCIGAFIGADTVCAMLSAGFPSPIRISDNIENLETSVKSPLLLADIGTNTEIALFIPATEKSSAKILCTSAAAGPAFEASNISCGMSSIEGAIDSISYNGDLVCHVIGDTNAKGICGSGLISAGATLLKHKYIDRNGVIQKSVSKLGDGSICIQLTPAVYLSQQDIRNMQLAKSAVKTGLAYMVERAPSLPIFCLAGGFGSNINITEACEIGLIPSELERRCVPLGNAALAGASALLFSKVLRRKSIEIAKNAYQINLAAVPDFQQRYLNSIDF